MRFATTMTFIALSLLLKWVYQVDKAKCNGCGNCVYFCPQGAITIAGGDAWIDPELCDGCGTCVNYCPRDAIYRVWYTGVEETEGPMEGLRPGVNPVRSGSLTVLGAEPGCEVLLLDRTGRTVSRGTPSVEGTVELDVNGLPAGSYRVISGEASASVSII